MTARIRANIDGGGLAGNGIYCSVRQAFTNASLGGIGFSLCVALV